MHEDYFSRLTLIKRGTVLFVSLHSATTIFVHKRGYASLDYISSPSRCSSRRVFFLPVKRALPKLRRFFVGGAVQTGFVSLHVFLRVDTDFATSR